MLAKYGNGVIVILLAAFYANIAYQNVKPSGLVSYEHAAAQSLNSPSPASPQTNYGARRALVAIKEQKLGVREAKKGCNCGPRVDLYTAGLRQQWCAMFVSWVFKESGTPFQGPDKTAQWRITNARQIAAYLQKSGVWYSKDYVLRHHTQPRVGDVMVFWRGNFEGNLGHADIVVGVNPREPGHASLIGGNLFDKVTYRESSYFAEYYGFLGFGRPHGEKLARAKTMPPAAAMSAHQPTTTPPRLTITDPDIRRLFEPELGIQQP